MLCRCIDRKLCIVYLAAQLAAAAVGLLALLRPEQPELAVVAGNAFLAELFFIFLLVFVILNVALAKSTAGNQFYGLAIGATVASGAWAVGDISVAAFNPAVATAFALLEIISWADLPVYLAGQFVGAAAAVRVFRGTTP